MQFSHNKEKINTLKLKRNITPIYFFLPNAKHISAVAFLHSCLYISTFLTVLLLATHVMQV